MPGGQSATFCVQSRRVLSLIVYHHRTELDYSLSWISLFPSERWLSFQQAHNILWYGNLWKISRPYPSVWETGLAVCCVVFQHSTVRSGDSRALPKSQQISSESDRARSRTSVVSKRRASAPSVTARKMLGVFSVSRPQSMTHSIIVEQKEKERFSSQITMCNGHVEKIIARALKQRV